jgi:deoxyribose-phosphate aldolase
MLDQTAKALATLINYPHGALHHANKRITTMKQNTINIPQAALIPASTMILQEDGNIKQLVYIDRSHKSDAQLELPMGKSLRASVTYFKDSSDLSGNTIQQQIRLYRNASKKYSTSIHDTRYSHVKVSQSRITVSMSFPLGDDPTRLKARMQNFANIIIDESDEIAAMLNQEGDELVLGAWEALTEQDMKGGEQ